MSSVTQSYIPSSAEIADSALFNSMMSDFTDGINDNHSRLTTAESNISTNTSDVSALDGRLTTAENNISTNTSDISTNASDISANDSELSDHESRISTLEGQDSIRVSGQSGGTDGKIVRLSSSETWTDADPSDTQAQLTGLLFKAGGEYYTPGSIVPLSGLSVGVAYFLSTGGALATVPPGSGNVVIAGKAISSTKFLFTPSDPRQLS